ncbi:ankyrin repeat domain-containing protein [Rickettsiales endosymbiont of Stachyamoeba lipophora]|uniref:ankyrin repeat domain-containing protein n=1 Tax=Rickettsiales endosymbiont of Stachyamoeba lipophora TaxID=2486578 RepID=UPI000F651F59|nr:ankyrin repeat domain-containing protein [Rickettsiales endosymbiont of Stachyamoeba lipophora]AZL16377.1 ankyrin repeat domain-containing protein [Rickettsiales endosymbiont of Stachyamoeba lipophora]
MLPSDNILTKQSNDEAISNALTKLQAVTAGYIYSCFFHCFSASLKNFEASNTKLKSLNDQYNYFLQAIKGIILSDNCFAEELVDLQEIFQLPGRLARVRDICRVERKDALTYHADGNFIRITIAHMLIRNLIFYRRQLESYKPSDLAIEYTEDNFQQFCIGDIKTGLEELTEDERKYLSQEGFTSDKIEAAIKEFGDKPESLIDESPYFQVIDEQNETKLSALLNLKRFDFNLKNKEGYPPINYALEHRLFNVALKLSNEVSFRPNTRDTKFLRTPLIAAAITGANKVVDKLLELPETDINLQNIYGATALMLAIAQKHTYIANKLAIQPMLNPNLVDQNGQSVLIHALMNGKVNIAKLIVRSLKEKINPNLAHPKSRSPILHYAVIHKKDFISMLLELPDIKVEFQDIENNTALHIAAARGRLEIAKLLLPRVNDPNVLNLHLFAPIHLALYNNHYLVAEEIIKHKKFNPNVVEGKFNKSALHWAVIKQQVHLVELLCQKQAKLNILDQEGYSPIHLTVKNNDMEALKILLKYCNKEELECLNGQGYTALTMAILLGSKQAYDLLSKHEFYNAEVRPLTHAFIQAVQQKDEGAAKKIAQFKNFNPNALNQWNKPLIYECIQINNKQLAKILYDHPQFNINYQDPDGYTALHYATLNKRADIAAELARKGDAINIQDKINYYTPIHHAVEMAELELIAVMIEREDIDLTLEGSYKGRMCTPIELATTLKFYSIAEKLRERASKIQQNQPMPPM